MYALRLRTRRLTERNATCNYLSRNSSPRNRIITRRVRQLRDYEQEDAPRTCLLEASTNFRATNLSTCNANHAIRQVGPKIFSRGRTRRKLILIFSTSLRASKFASDDSTDPRHHQCRNDRFFLLFLAISSHYPSPEFRHFATWSVTRTCYAIHDFSSFYLHRDARHGISLFRIVHTLSSLKRTLNYPVAW